MEGFDTTTMSYLTAASMSLSNVTTADSLAMPLLPLDRVDHHSNFDAETFAGEEASHYGAHSLQLQQPPALRRFPSAYDDPFSDSLSASYDPTGLSAPDQNGLESVPNIERDHKLLSFSVPTINYTLLDYTGRPARISMSAQLHGMFFLAEPLSTSTAPNDAASAPSAQQSTEVTCYRRNLFQVTGTITLTRGTYYVQTEHGDRIPIVNQELTISATESVEGSSVKIISVPWKTPATSAPAPVVTPEEKTEKEPGSIPLDLLSHLHGQGENQDDLAQSEYVTFPLSFKRLQFRIATANNGRRKELQQHFVVHLRLMATLATGARVILAESRSGAIIVRGRSPRNFQSRKDLPLSSGGPGGGSARRNNSHAALARTSTSESHPGITQTQSQTSREQPPINPVEISPLSFAYENPELQSSPDLARYPHAQTHTYPRSHSQYAGGGAPAVSGTYGGGQAHRPGGAPKPIVLSLFEEETNCTASPTSGQAVGQGCGRGSKMARLGSGSGMTGAGGGRHGSGGPSFDSAGGTALQQHTGFNTMNLGVAPLANAPEDSAGLLYEYFPLGLDDWMPPVDAVYRPHVVHHTNLPSSDPKVIVGRGRSKRYFSEVRDNS
ncbi:p53-like transcription factor [Trichodelitschia bisporula]|uniref:p53-like transcription factor n=1 Tax=Trichodelitschia bisporula TaxID=703511 RepID=A0A6G1HK18_9PEZI|nr:p53-like transcription factor [Trichodelitschia bisporula]